MQTAVPNRRGDDGSRGRSTIRVVVAVALLFVLTHAALVSASGVALTAATTWAHGTTAGWALLNSRGADVFAVDVQRVLFTIAGALLTAVLVTVLDLVFNRHQRNTAEPESRIAVRKTP